MVGCSSTDDPLHGENAGGNSAAGAPGGGNSAIGGGSPEGGSTAAGGSLAGAATAAGRSFAGTATAAGGSFAGTATAAGAGGGMLGRGGRGSGTGGSGQGRAGAGGSAGSSSSGAGGANAAGAGGTSDPYASARQACVDRINAFRATESLGPLARWTAQETCADSQAKSDSSSGKAHGAFGTCKESAQNECPGWGSVDQTVQGCLQQMWNEGPGEPYSAHGHYINMSSTTYQQVACGFYQIPGGKVWAVQDFH